MKSPRFLLFLNCVCGALGSALCVFFSFHYLERFSPVISWYPPFFAFVVSMGFVFLSAYDEYRFRARNEDRIRIGYPKSPFEKIFLSLLFGIVIGLASSISVALVIAIALSS